MNIIQEAHQRLFPSRQFNYNTKIEYNRRLSDFNANISVTINKIVLKMNLQWKDIDEEIKIGLIQHLLLRVFKVKKITTTPNVNLYNNFVKNIPLLTPKTKKDPLLCSSFERVNLQFFQGDMEKPNLKWGRDSRRKLACYNFHNDTVTVSTLFKNCKQEILDYLMYHELLHKHHKFKHNNGRNSFHSPEFKRDEALYPNYKQLEKEMNQIIRTSLKSKKIYLKSKEKVSFWDYFKA